MRLHVQCYAGHRGEETPRRFNLGGRDLEVAEVVDRWLSPDHRYFKVRVREKPGGGSYVLRHDIVEDLWELVMFVG